jgi:ParB/RepB/Spo0J family partition protein
MEGNVMTITTCSRPMLQHQRDQNVLVSSPSSILDDHPAPPPDESAGHVAQSRVISLPLHCLIEDSANDRKTFRNMKGLIATVRVMGVIEPIDVVPVPKSAEHADSIGQHEERYVIVAGERRFRAAKAVGLDTIPAIIWPSMDQWQLHLRSVVSNLQRDNLNGVELARALDRLRHELPGVRTQQQLADFVGLERSVVTRLLGILRLPAEILDQCGMCHKELPQRALSALVPIKDPALLRELADALAAGASLAAIRARIPKASGIVAPARFQRYRTASGATVIVQGKRLSDEQAVVELRDALGQAERAIAEKLTIAAASFPAAPPPQFEGPSDGVRLKAAKKNPAGAGFNLG